MPRNLTFHTFAEKKPDHDQWIFFLETSSFYSSIEPKFDKVEYCWFEIDEEGDDTGMQIIYDPADPEPPEACELRFLLSGGFEGKDQDLWCPADDVDKLVDEE